jgi:tetratricopeptide (TPR) repeat protein
MPGLFHFLRCVGKAVVKNGARALANLLPFGEVLFDIARDTQEEYCKDHPEAELSADLEGLAQASPAEVRQAADVVAAEVACDQPAAVRVALTSFLTQLPASIRQSLRRPSDPSGKYVPAGLSLRKPEDLLRFLPADLPRFKPGDQPLAADWELVELLGKGGFGEVWKARHIHQSRKKPVALKFCLDPVTAATLRNEAALHNILDRVREEASAPGIVPLLETYLGADPPCLMYEFIEGGDLAGLVQDMGAQDRLTTEFATKIIHRLASIVAVAHQLNPPIVHRDLKMSNVLVRQGDGDLPDLFIADFGIGGLASGQALRMQAGRRVMSIQLLPTAIRGAYTPLYASPQQVQGESPTPRDDVHALGVIWYQLLSGDMKLLSLPPDWRDVVQELGLGEQHAQLMASCIASRAERRLADAGQLADQLAIAAITLRPNHQKGASPHGDLLAPPLGNAKNKQRQEEEEAVRKRKENVGNHGEEQRQEQERQQGEGKATGGDRQEGARKNREPTADYEAKGTVSPAAMVIFTLGAVLFLLAHCHELFAGPRGCQSFLAWGLGYGLLLVVSFLLARRQCRKGILFAMLFFLAAGLDVAGTVYSNSFRQSTAKEIASEVRQPQKEKVFLGTQATPVAAVQAPQTPAGAKAQPAAVKHAPQAPTAVPSKEALSFLSQGNAWFNNKDYDEAIKAYDEAVRLDPNVPVTYFSRGNAWWLKNDPDKAIQDYSQAIRLNPKYALAYYMRGSAWLRKKEFDKAIQDNDEAIRLDPKFANAFNNRGSSWSWKNDPDKAIQDYDEAIRLDPKFVVAYNNRGREWIKKKQYDKALGDFDEAIRLVPNVSSAYCDRGIAWSGKGDFDKAIKDLDEAIRLDPNNSFASTVRGIVLSRKK